jgi:hypothetical protein
MQTKMAEIDFQRQSLFIREFWKHNGNVSKDVLNNNSIFARGKGDQKL